MLFRSVPGGTHRELAISFWTDNFLHIAMQIGLYHPQLSFQIIEAWRVVSEDSPGCNDHVIVHVTKSLSC